MFRSMPRICCDPGEPHVDCAASLRPDQGTAATKSARAVEVHPRSATEQCSVPCPESVAIRANPTSIVLPLSARTKEQLQQKARELLKFIRAQQPSNVPFHGPNVLRSGRTPRRLCCLSPPGPRNSCNKKRESC